MGAHRFVARVDCEPEFEGPAGEWLQKVSEAVAGAAAEAAWALRGGERQRAGTGGRCDGQRNHLSEARLQPSTTALRESIA